LCHIKEGIEEYRDFKEDFKEASGKAKFDML